MSAETSDIQVKAPTEPWRQRLIRTLLYGKNVDRNVKASAQVLAAEAQTGQTSSA